MSANTQRARQLGTEWAFFGQSTKWISPKKESSDPKDKADKSAHAYWVVEDAIGKTVRHIAGPKHVEYWSSRIRGVLIAKYRDGVKLDPAECRWLRLTMAQAVRIDRERSAIFEAA